MKTIMLSDEAYKKLASIKGDKSFTELVIVLVDRLKQTNTKEIMKFAGIMNDKEAEKLQKIVKNIRKRARARI
jgi:predicted CopG family antitoxin